MNANEEQVESRTTKLGHQILAGVILLVCAYVLFHLLFGIVVAVLTAAAVVAAIIGVVWAVRVLF
jgi:hypothetical protein